MYSQNSVKATPVDFIDKLKETNERDNKMDHARAMMAKLTLFGLPEIYCQVVTCRMCFEWSYKDIAEELGIPHRETAFYIFQEAIKLLRERQYE